VALLQADLNRWLECWGAPGQLLLSRDGVLGEGTATLANQVGIMLGLTLQSADGGFAVPVRERAVVRHEGRRVQTAERDEACELPAIAMRTGEEIAREQRLAPELAAKVAAARAQPLKRAGVNMDVANRSTRNGLKPTLIVLHARTGHRRLVAPDLTVLGQLLGRPDAGESVHVANDRMGRDARYIGDRYRAFAAGQYDAVALHLQQLGGAEAEVWPVAQLVSTAAWIAFWCTYWGIPVARSTECGVCEHSDLDSSAPDCGSDYPLDEVLTLAAERVTSGWDGNAAAASNGRGTAIAEYPQDVLDHARGQEEEWLEERLCAAQAAASAASGATPKGPPAPVVDRPRPADTTEASRVERDLKGFAADHRRRWLPDDDDLTRSPVTVSNALHEKERSMKIPKTTTPLTKFIRTLEGILLLLFNLAMLIVPIITSALSPEQAAKWAGVLDAVAVVARSGLKAVASLESATGAPAAKPVSPAVEADVAKLAGDVAEQVPPDLAKTPTMAELLSQIQQDVAAFEKLVKDAEGHGVAVGNASG
jgi:hypothetical protein